MYAVVDFDNSEEAWKRYDGMTARELFYQYGVSERLYRESFEPMLLVGLFAPGEQCSAAAALGMLYYFILAHQADFDVVWCRGTVGEKIFKPWCDRIQDLGGKILTNRRVSDVRVNADGQVTGVICGGESFDADAVIFSVGISGMQKIVISSPALQKRREFRNLMNLGAVDVLAVRLWCDRKIIIPRPSNACFGFDKTTGWTFFDLNALHDEYANETGSVIEVDFYHANQFLPLDNQEIIAIVQKYLADCIPEFNTAKVIDSSVIRLPRAVTHFSPGSYQHLLRGITSFPNLYMSGDWIITNHGSWSQEKAYVTGLEAANLVIQQFNQGNMTQILPIESDEPHIQIARSLNQTVKNVAESIIRSLWMT
jgi:uncharacterized protein with NAD-binding domain and iron-sulfur cluster